MLAAVRIWILLSTLLVSAGWILSALHQLNRAGYAIFFVLTGIAGFFWCQKNHWPARGFFSSTGHKFLRRCRRPLPLLFLVLALMTFLAGALYVPCNNDTNEYRIPRVWHWLAQGHWHWISTLDYRMNIAGCGFEWLCAPVMLFTQTDRFIFLLNWVSYLLLPGLIFSVFTRHGCAPARVVVVDVAARLRLVFCDAGGLGCERRALPSSTRSRRLTSPCGHAKKTARPTSGFRCSRRRC